MATGSGLATSDSDTINVTVTAVNDPVTGTAPANLSAAEDVVSVAVTGLSISDVDATLAPAGVYSVTLSASQGTLTLSTTTGLTFDTGDGSADATMTFHGTLSDINTAVATATYAPNANFNGSDTIVFSVTDTFGGIVATGTGLATSDSDNVAVTVSAVNDNVTSNAPATATVDEDVATPIAGLSISDVDATLAPAGVYDVTLAATNGTLTLTTLTGLTFTAGDGTADATMTFHGTLSNINNGACDRELHRRLEFQRPGADLDQRHRYLRRHRCDRHRQRHERQRHHQRDGDGGERSSAVRRCSTTADLRPRRLRRRPRRRRDRRDVGARRSRQRERQLQRRHADAPALAGRMRTMCSERLAR